MKFLCHTPKPCGEKWQYYVMKNAINVFKLLESPIWALKWAAQGGGGVLVPGGV